MELRLQEESSSSAEVLEVLSLFLVTWVLVSLALHAAFGFGMLPGSALLGSIPLMVSLLGHFATLTAARRWNVPNPSFAELRRAWGVASPLFSVLYLYAGAFALVVVAMGMAQGDSHRPLTPAELQLVGSVLSLLSAAWCAGNWGVLKLPHGTRQG